jgi:lanosterol synthase
MTYGTFHAVRGLRAAGVPGDSPALRRAAGWLVRHQKPDGGWGEHHTGCLRGRYVEHPYSQAVMTSWAVLALADVLGPEHEAVRRGAAWLASRQSDDGSWPREAVNGVFFGTAMLDYELYRAYFPLWALARVSGRPAAPLPT